MYNERIHDENTHERMFYKEWFLSISFAHLSLVYNVEGQIQLYFSKNHSFLDQLVLSVFDFI